MLQAPAEAAFTRRGVTALVCLVAFACGFVPRAASARFDEQARALQLLDAQSCAQRATRVAQAQEAASPSPSPLESASPQPTPTFPAMPNGQVRLYATPRPRSSPATPPPVPTPTPNPNASSGPVFLVRGGETPPPITPAGSPPPAPTPVPTGAPTLPPGYIAVLADRVVGNTHQGTPADAIGNVHIFYKDDELVGRRAHYDGIRTLTVTGHPFIIDRARDAVLNADTIVFDTITQQAKLVGGSGESSQGVERGLVYFKAADMHTDADGIGHGTHFDVSTCANERGGYHLTGKNGTYYPGDKIVITNVLLFLGAVAVFWLPRVVIPLRQVENETRRPSFFPEIGYDQAEGAYVKMKYGFGKDRYYYGYYRVEYFTKVGLGLGYVGFFAKKNGRRTASIDYYGIHDRRTQTSTRNLNAQEQENFSRTLRGNFQFRYQSAFGALTNLPPNTGFNATIMHSGLREQQTYGFQHSGVGSQSSVSSFTFTDAHQFTPSLSQATNFQLQSSNSNYGGSSSSNSTAHFTTLTHLTTKAADYQLTFDKTFTGTPYGYDKLPELQIRPYTFFRHFLFPVQAAFTVGDYSEPGNHFNTSRADMLFTLGPALYKIFGSDFSANAVVDQDAYGTGDLKAKIAQNMSLNTPIGRHFVNSITYSEQNFAGPAFVPFQYLDNRSPFNTKNAQDLMRFFNGDVYTFTMGFSTSFNALAQPVSYQLSARPSPRSVVMLGGAFIPGIGQGFSTTNVQFATPFGRDTTLQFIGDIDWKNRARIENKTIFLSKIIGDCYEIRLQYNQASKDVNITVNLLAFPSRSAGFGIGQNGPIIPTSLNF